MCPKLSTLLSADCDVVCPSSLGRTRVIEPVLRPKLATQSSARLLLFNKTTQKLAAAMVPIPPNTAISRTASSLQSNCNTDSSPSRGCARALAVIEPMRNPDNRQDQALTNPIRRNTKKTGSARIVIGAAVYARPINTQSAKYTGLIRPERSLTTQNIAYSSAETMSAANNAMATDSFSVASNRQVRLLAVANLRIPNAGTED